MENTLRVDSRQISVVIQGPVRHGRNVQVGVGDSIASIRRILPDAEIIVSTWVGQNVESLDAEIIILNKDPGALTSSLGLSNNVNRQIVSTLAGVKASTRPYVLKFRADLVLKDSSIAQILTIDDSYSSFKFFQSCITTSNLYVTNHYEYPQLFHASDVVQFGRKDDILDYWDQPLFSEHDVFLSYSDVKTYFEKVVFHGGIKLVPEQLLTLGWLAKRGYEFEVPRRHFGDSNLLTLWEKILVSNFNVLNHNESGVVFPRRFTKDQYMARHNFSEGEIRDLRRRAFSEGYKANFSRFRLAKYWVLLTVTPSHLADVAAATMKSKNPRLHSWLRPLWHPIRKMLRL